jgi:hypothetical protein
MPTRMLGQHERKQAWSSVNDQPEGPKSANKAKFKLERLWVLPRFCEGTRFEQAKTSQKGKAPLAQSR